MENKDNIDNQDTNRFKINPKVVDYVEKTTKPEHREEMKKLLEAYFQSQIDEGYTNVKIYKDKTYTISDIMLYHKSGKKVLLFITYFFPEKDDGIVKMYTGQFSDDEDDWVFTDGGIPQFYYAYDEEGLKGKPFTEQMLMSRTIDKLVEDGLITFYGAISQDYLENRWF